MKKSLTENFNFCAVIGKGNSEIFAAHVWNNVCITYAVKTFNNNYCCKCTEYLFYLSNCVKFSSTRYFSFGQ